MTDFFLVTHLMTDYVETKIKVFFSTFYPISNIRKDSFFKKKLNK